MSSMHIEFAGEHRHLGQRDLLTFGREADLEIDSNVLLPLILGQVRCHSGVWWLTNNSQDIVLEVYDRNSLSRISVAAGAGVPISFLESSVRFIAGRAAYALEIRITGGLLAAGAAPTSSRDRVALNEDQRLLLLALAEPLLRGEIAAGGRLPTNKAVAERLGWRMPKFNRKLDHLCLKFHKLGVVGLKGDQSSLAGNRRQVLIDHVLASDIIRVEDLALLDERVKSLCGVS